MDEVTLEWEIFDILSKSLILDEKVNVKHLINEMIHKHNVLKFWVKMWCHTHLCVVHGPI
jgi:hypothetical protein